MENSSEEEMKSKDGNTVIPALFRSFHDNRDDKRSTIKHNPHYYDTMHTKISSPAHR